MKAEAGLRVAVSCITAVGFVAVACAALADGGVQSSPPKATSSIETKCLSGQRTACVELAKKEKVCPADDLACRAQAQRWQNVVRSMDQLKTDEDLGRDNDIAISRQQLEDAKQRAQRPTVAIEPFSNPNYQAPTPVVIEGTGPYKARNPGWERGMHSTMACGNPGWVRGRGSLQLPGGTLSLTIQLETDDVSQGPKGRLTARIKDAQGNVLTTATTAELSTGGKLPGKAKIVNYSQSVQLPPAVVASAKSLEVEAECTGAEFRVFDIPLSDVARIFTIAVSPAPTP